MCVCVGGGGGGGGGGGVIKASRRISNVSIPGAFLFYSSSFFRVYYHGNQKFACQYIYIAVHGMGGGEG